MSFDPQVSRRTVLAVGAAGGVGSLVLAGCSNGSSGGDGSGGGSGGAPSQSAGKPLTALAAVPVGGAKAVKLPDGSPAVVFRSTATSAACFSAICTHEGCTVAPQGSKLDCPCHGSQFDAATGKVLRGPASQPLPRIDVSVTGGNVVTA
jgi:Rieske Fe-S protein